MTKLEKKICCIANTILNVTDKSDRNKTTVYNISNLLEQIKGTYAKKLSENFCEIFNLNSVIIGDWGECGKVIFLDSQLDVMFELAFEDSNNGVNSFFVK